MSSELGEVEVTDAGKYPYQIYLAIIIGTPIALIIIFAIVFKPIPNFMLITLIITSAAIIGVFVPLILHFRKKITEPRTVIINKKGIQVVFPRSKSFQIDWYEFNSLYIRVIGYPSNWDTVGEVVSALSAFSGAYVPLGRAKSRRVRIHFRSLDSPKPVKKLDLQLFNDQKVDEVLQGIVKFAEKSNKALEFHKGTKKFYKL